MTGDIIKHGSFCNELGTNEWEGESEKEVRAGERKITYVCHMYNLEFGAITTQSNRIEHITDWKGWNNFYAVYVYYKLGLTDQRTCVSGNVNSQADKTHAVLVKFFWLRRENILSRRCKEMLLTYRSQWQFRPELIKPTRLERRLPVVQLCIFNGIFT